MDLAHAKRIFNEMKNTRAPWMSAWKELAQYIAPSSGAFDDDPKSKQGKKFDHKTILDSTALRAVAVLSAGMMSGLTSPSRSWFELTLGQGPAQTSNPVQRWLYAVKQCLEQVFAKSNVYAVLHNFYEEVAVFATAAFLVEEDFHTVLRCRALTIGEFMLGENEKGQIDRFAREFYMSAYQMVCQFGLDNVPLHVKQAFLNHKYDTLHKCYHVIAPNLERNTRKLSARHMPFVSIYWADSAADKPLRVSGYHDFPVIAARWDLKRAGDVYGRGPGWQVLGDVKMLQKMQKTKLVALDKATNPPMMVSAKVVGEVNLLPGGITRYNDSTDPAVRPVYQVQPDLQNLERSIEQTRMRISEQFFADMFLMISNIDAGKMTATEVAERTQEKMMMLGPVLERLKNELLDPLIERAFNICLRAGILPEPPEEIQGKELQVSYISMIAQAQKATALNTLQRGAQFAAELAQIQAAGAPVLDNVDFDGALRTGLNALGVPPKMLLAQQEVEQTRQARQAAAQQQAQQAQLAQAVNQAKTLAQTPLNTGSALDAAVQGVSNG